MRSTTCNGYASEMWLGIDFGTTRIVVASSDRGNYPVVTFESPNGEIQDWFPPLVAVCNGEWLYGWEAWAVQEDPSATVVRSLKRYLGDAGPDTPVEIANTSSPLSTILSELASALHKALLTNSNLNVPPDEKLEVMLGVPAGANSNQRFLTVDAFRRAGFSVLGMLNEPSAASIEYGHSRGSQAPPKEHLLIYDLGGGTFDVSLVALDSHSHVILASDGIPTLGGDDFDLVLADLALPDQDGLTQSELFRLYAECRAKKETLNPNSRKLVIDLDVVRPGLGPVTVPVSEFYRRCQPLIEKTLHAVADVANRVSSLEALYVTGGGSEMPAVSRQLREVYGRKVKRSPYTRAATAIGLAIQANRSSGYVLRDRFTRYFGVWREWDGGRLMRFDPLFAKGTDLPQGGEPPLEQTRTYTAVHNIGHFRYLECSHLNGRGEPAGDITLWDEVHFPFAPELQGAADLSAMPVEHAYLDQQIGETYHCGAGGELEVVITNLTSGYERKYLLGRWGGKKEPIVPGKKKRAPAARKKAAG